MVDQAPGIEYRWSLFDREKGAPSVVEKQFTLAQGYAADAYRIAQELLRSLSDIAGTLKMIDTNVVLENASYQARQFTEIAPVKPAFTMNMPSPPDRAVFKNIDLSSLTIPDASDIIVRTDMINPGESSYGSPLLTALKAKILNDVVYGGTGLGATIETQLWQRDIERDLLDHEAAMDRIAAQWSSRGLPLPDGTLVAALTQEEIDFTNRRNDKVRLIAIEMAKIADVNTRFAVERAAQLEQILMNYQNTVAQRLFEASKATADMQIASINAEIAKKRIMTDIYRTLADVKIAEARAIVDIYTSEVNAYAAEIGAEATRIDAIVRTFLAEIEAYKADVSVYEALTNVELKILDTQTRLAIARAELYLKNADIQIREYEALNNLKVETIKAEGAVAAQLVAGALSSLHAQASIHAGDSASYDYNASSVEVAGINKEAAVEAAQIAAES